MPMARLGVTKYFDIVQQASPRWEGIGCTVCCNHLTLLSSLPKALTAEQGSQVSSWYRGTYWACASCGQAYETTTFVINRPVKDRDSTLTRNSRKWVYSYLATSMLTMLQGISYIGRLSKKGVSGSETINTR